MQIAKHLGAEVTGVCSPRNVELVRSLGADHVVDYTKQDFTRASGRYDLLSWMSPGAVLGRGSLVGWRKKRGS